MPRLSGYETTGHVLEQIARFHERLSECFQALTRSASDTRASMLLDYLNRHQQERARALRDYLVDAPSTLLENWFQIPFPQNPDAFLHSIDANADLDTQQIDDLVARVDEFLQNLLHYLVQRAETGNVKAAFEELQSIDAREKNLRSRAMASFERL